MLRTCKDERDCFAKVKGTVDGDKCRLLLETYPDGECPFCKPEPTVTKGKAYPWKPEYGKST